MAFLKRASLLLTSILESATGNRKSDMPITMPQAALAERTEATMPVCPAPGHRKLGIDVGSWQQDGNAPDGGLPNELVAIPGVGGEDAVKCGGGPATFNTDKSKRDEGDRMTVDVAARVAELPPLSASILGSNSNEGMSDQSEWEGCGTARSVSAGSVPRIRVPILSQNGTKTVGKNAILVLPNLDPMLERVARPIHRPAVVPSECPPTERCNASSGVVLKHHQNAWDCFVEDTRDAGVYESGISSSPPRFPSVTVDPDPEFNKDSPPLSPLAPVGEFPWAALAKQSVRLDASASLENEEQPFSIAPTRPPGTPRPPVESSPTQDDSFPFPSPAQRLSWFRANFRSGFSSADWVPNEGAEACSTTEKSQDQEESRLQHEMLPVDRWLQVLTFPTIIVTEPSNDVPSTNNLPTCRFAISDLLATMGFPYPVVDPAVSEEWPQYNSLYVVSERCTRLQTDPPQEENLEPTATDSDSEYTSDYESDLDPHWRDSEEDDTSVDELEDAEEQEIELEDRDMNPESADNAIVRLLGSLATGNTPVISKQVATVFCQALHSTPSHWSFVEAIDTFITHVQGEPVWSVEYALICRNVLEDAQMKDVPFTETTEDEKDSRTNSAMFRTMLGYHCVETLRDICAAIDAAARDSVVSKPSGRGSEDTELLGTRLANLTRFLVELYRADVLTEHLMYTCMVAFLKDVPARSPPLAKLTSLVVLLRAVGAQLEHSELMQKHLTVFFNRLAKLRESRTPSARICLEIEGLIQLRRAGWKDVNGIGCDDEGREARVSVHLTSRDSTPTNPTAPLSLPNVQTPAE